MAKLKKTSQDVQEEILEIIGKVAPSLVQIGIDTQFMSTSKSKEIIKVTRASATTEFMANKDKVGEKALEGMLLIVVYEEAWDRLGEDDKEKVVELSMVGVSIDTENGKLTVSNDNLRNAIALCQKYGNDVMQKVELAYLTISQIEDEEAERKAEEKAMKLAKKKGNA